MSSGIITFRSDRFDTSPLEDGLDPEQHPLGRDLAIYLIDKLRSSPDVTRVDSEPERDHDQWCFDLAANGKKYRLAAHVVEEATPQCLWAVQMCERVGMLRSLLRSGERMAEDPPPG